MVVVGGGFGGLQAALHLARLPVDVTLVDRRNFHLFQPLAYQVATGALSPAEISYPLRRIFRRRSNVRVVLAEVTDFDLDARLLCLRAVAGERAPEILPYDTLIVAAGADYNYFQHESWPALAPNLKTLEGALTIRRRILEAFEAAELEPDPGRRTSWLTFAVVGTGPTGVEMAGQIAEIAHDVRGDFTSLDSRDARILLIEAGEPVLSELPPSLSNRAVLSLERLGVETLLEHAVVDTTARRSRWTTGAATGSGSTPGRSSGQRGSWRRGSDPCSPTGPAFRSTEPDALRFCRTYPFPAIPSCWRSET